MTTEKIMRLPVSLDDSELIQRSQRLASMIAEEKALLDKRKAQTNTVNEDLKALKAEIAATSHVVASRTEIREIVCEEVKDLDSGILNVIRKDTNEVIDSRHLTIAERQGDLPFEREEGERHTSYSSKDNSSEGSFDDDETPPPPAERAKSKRRKANVPEPEFAEA